MSILDGAGLAGILPDEQFGNRPQRSTEAAVKLVVHSISPYGLESQG